MLAAPLARGGAANPGFRRRVERATAIGTANNSTVGGMPGIPYGTNGPYRSIIGPLLVSSVHPRVCGEQAGRQACLLATVHPRGCEA
jgi:hypothetical protein